MKIWNAFIFWNEFDLLKLRLAELGDVVDRFVLVEGDRTFQGARKPYEFFESRYGHPKLAAFTMWLPELAREPMDREKLQRNYISYALQLLDIAPDDLVIVTDADEIPSRHAVRMLATGTYPPFCRLGMRLYHYWMNLRIVGGDPSVADGYWYSPICVPARALTSHSVHDLRWNAHPLRVQDAGWSFSFLGDVATHQAKLAAWSHHEWNVAPYNTAENIEQARRLGIDWDFKRQLKHQWIAPELDDSYPRYVREHRELFARYIAEPPVLEAV